MTFARLFPIFLRETFPEWIPFWFWIVPRASDVDFCSTLITLYCIENRSPRLHWAFKQAWLPVDIRGSSQQSNGSLLSLSNLTLTKARFEMDHMCHICLKVKKTTVEFPRICPRFHWVLNQAVHLPTHGTTRKEWRSSMQRKPSRDQGLRGRDLFLIRKIACDREQENHTKWCANRRYVM